VDDDRAGADVPQARGTLLAGAVGAVAKLWGDDGTRDVRARVSAEAAQALCDRIVLPVAWYPEAIMREWCEAVWDGPARQDFAAFATFVHRSVDHGWRWTHRAIIRLATPRAMARRAPAIWQHDHTHGVMTVDLGESMATLKVVDYPQRDSLVMRRGHAESLRYIMTLARFGNVRASQALDAEGAYVATLRWG
jgi:hypothetical protein